METVDEEITEGALDFIERAHTAGKPFFLWWNSTRMHIWTHLKPASQGVTGIGIYPDGLVEHDRMVGQLLDKLDELGIADNTIVMYSTDNGAEVMSWPDGGTTPFRGEKNTNWEGGYRVPTLIRWPGVIEPGTIYNDVFAHEDMLPTLLAAAGVSDVKEQLKKGMKIGEKTFKVHVDGYNILVPDRVVKRRKRVTAGAQPANRDAKAGIRTFAVNAVVVGDENVGHAQVRIIARRSGRCRGPLFRLDFPEGAVQLREDEREEEEHQHADDADGPFVHRACSRAH